MRLERSKVWMVLAFGAVCALVFGVVAYLARPVEPGSRQETAESASENNGVDCVRRSSPDTVVVNLRAGCEKDAEAGNPFDTLAVSVASEDESTVITVADP